MDNLKTEVKNFSDWSQIQWKQNLIQIHTIFFQIQFLKMYFDLKISYRD